MVTYSQIFTRFMATKIDDPKFFSLTESMAYEMMTEWLTASFADSFIKKLFKTFEPDNELMQIDFTLKHPENENADNNFIIELLSTSMYINYLTPQVNSTINTIQMFGGKEEKFYSQSAHLEVLEDKLARAKVYLRKMIRDHNYVFITGGEDTW